MENNIENIVENIKNSNKMLFLAHDPDTCLKIFNSFPEALPYHYIPESILKIWNSITKEFGADGFDAFQRLTMLRLIAAFSDRRSNLKYTNSVITCFSRSFARITGSIADPKFEKYRSINDILLKDLGLCRQKIFPAGAQVVEPDSGFHRSLGLRGGVGQAFRMVRLLLGSGGNNHWYQIHTHLSELEDFTPEGWNACYLRLAEMLESNPAARGMWGGSWFYDPALESISPRLVYLRKVPQENGAYLFYSNIDINGGALSKSESRKKAYETGEYLPKSYALIWPRNPLLAWANKLRDSNRQ